jgi:predicted transcriptional regulator
MFRRRKATSKKTRLSVSVPESLAEAVDGAAVRRRQPKTVLYEEALQTFFDPNSITVSFRSDVLRDLNRLAQLTKSTPESIAVDAIKSLLEREKQRYGNEFAYQQSILFGPYG